jgi:hypothetical protein
MTDTSTTPAPRKRLGAGRVALIVSGSVAALTAAGLFALGGLALWGDGQKDDQGYLSTDSHRFAASSHALVSENLDIDLDGVEDLVTDTDLGDSRLTVQPGDDGPVFAGIARTDDVASYLRGIDHTEVSDFDAVPFRGDYSERPGAGKPARPADQSIWVASTQGTGTQTLDWDAEDGDWSVVVMNADGSSGVQADVKVGTKISFLDELGWGLVGGGGFFLLAAAGLIVLGVRPPRTGSSGAPVGPVAPAAG